MIQKIFGISRQFFVISRQFLFWTQTSRLFPLFSPAFKKIFQKIIETCLLRDSRGTLKALTWIFRFSDPRICSPKSWKWKKSENFQNKINHPLTFSTRKYRVLIIQYSPQTRYFWRVCVATLKIVFDDFRHLLRRFGLEIKDFVVKNTQVGHFSQ